MRGFLKGSKESCQGFLKGARRAVVGGSNSLLKSSRCSARTVTEILSWFDKGSYRF